MRQYIYDSDTYSPKHHSMTQSVLRGELKAGLCQEIVKSVDVWMMLKSEEVDICETGGSLSTTMGPI